MPMVMTSVRTDAASATCLASKGFAAGRDATTTEPTSGTAPRTVTHGKALTSDPHEHDGSDDQGGAGEHGQCVGADDPRLIAADPTGDAADQSGQAVDRTVDHSVVEEHQGAGEVLPRSHDDGLVESILEQVLARGTGQRAAHRSHHRHRLGTVDLPG